MANPFVVGSDSAQPKGRGSKSGMKSGAKPFVETSTSLPSSSDNRPNATVYTDKGPKGLPKKS